MATARCSTPPPSPTSASYVGETIPHLDFDLDPNNPTSDFSPFSAVYDEYGDPIPLTGDLNNVGWFDDAADGPVSATFVFDDGSAEQVFGAWVICGDPGYTPQIRNVVSVWDDVYDAWVRNLDLRPDLYADGRFDRGDELGPGEYLDMAQRPDAVHPATETVNGVLPPQVWSIRGPGTLTNDPKSSATFQKALQSVTDWDRIGVVLQGTVIDGDHPPDFFLEAESLLPIEGQSVNVVASWPFNANPPAGAG